MATEGVVDDRGGTTAARIGAGAVDGSTLR